MAQSLSESQIRQKVRGMLARRFLLRFHVSLILLWTFAAGLLTTKLLLWLGVTSMLWRYPLAVLVAYLGFLLAVRVWLWYVGIPVQRRRDDDWFDVPSVDGGSRSSGGTVEPPMRPGGGSFGGGGASGDYVVDPALSAELASPLTALESMPAAAEAGATESLLEGIGSVAADEAAIPLAVVALVLGALLLVFSAGALVLIDAPALLAEAAFEALLAGGLIRAVRRVGDPDWSAAVVRRTWLSATLILLLSVAVALAVQHYRPGIITLGELLLAP